MFAIADSRFLHAWCLPALCQTQCLQGSRLGATARDWRRGETPGRALEPASDGSRAFLSRMVHTLARMGSSKGLFLPLSASTTLCRLHLLLSSFFHASAHLLPSLGRTASSSIAPQTASPNPTSRKRVVLLADVPRPFRARRLDFGHKKSFPALELTKLELTQLWRRPASSMIA